MPLSRAIGAGLVALTFIATARATPPATNPPPDTGVIVGGATADVGALKTFTLNIPRVSGCGGAVTGTVTLTQAAAAGGATVTIDATTGVTDAPASVVVAAGKTSATFSVTGKPVATAQTVTLSASYGGVTKTQPLTVDPAARYPYRVEMIDTLGGTFSLANAINARGQVVGTADTPDNIYHALRTDANLVPTDITPAAIDDYHGSAINNSGQVAGERVIYPNPLDPGYGILVRIEPDGTIHEFTPNDGSDTYAQGINAGGQMTGYLFTAGANSVAFRTSAAGVVTTLGRLSSGSYSLGLAINDSGQVAGMANDRNNADRAYRTTATGNLSTATVLGPAYSGAYAINAGGVVTGETFNSGDGLRHLFRASSESDWQDLGTFPNYNTKGEAINTRGDIVGSIYTIDSETKAVGEAGAILYTAENGLRNLNTLIDPTSGWLLYAAYDINDFGQIIGFGLVNGVTRGFRLTPTGAPFPYGDANRDGAVNLADAALMLQIAGGLSSTPDLRAADIAPIRLCDPIGFGDNRVDILDAVRLTRRIAGLEPVWP
jgi:probable HAF family extracellular repeat protein